MATKHLENAWAEILPWQSEIRKKDQLYSRKKPLTEQVNEAVSIIFGPRLIRRLIPCRLCRQSGQGEISL